MNPERLSLIAGVLEGALERTPDVREAFLRDACHGDEDLRREVDALLVDATAARDFLKEPALNLLGLGDTVAGNNEHSLLGQKIGSYVIVGFLGAGGMGEVYRARDTRLDRDVAIKILPRAFNADPGRRARFDREARMLAALNHPHIGAIYGVEENDNERALVLELVEGDTLADRLRRGRVSADEALRYAQQIADALAAAHAKGIVHRDLKPANIKITPQGVVKVLDFGLAKAALDDVTAIARPDQRTVGIGSAQGAILGTPAYMSPEQALGKSVDKRADIWAFGVVLYEMFTGHKLSREQLASNAMASALLDAPGLDGVPANVRRLVQRCLRSDPDDRLQDIADWKLLLVDDGIDVASRATARVRIWRVIVGLLLVSVAALVATQLRTGSKPAQEVRSQIPKPDGLTFNPGTQAAISPDGRWLAFPAVGPDGESRMYVRALDSLEVRALPGSEGILRVSPPPFWSHDSRFVGYAAQGKLKLSEVTGTPARTVTDAGLRYVQGGTWNEDGTILYARHSGTLEQVSSNGGTAAPVTRLNAGETAHRYPQFLPDGRRFLYLRVSRTVDETGVYVGSLDMKPEERPLKPLVQTNRQAWWVTSDVSGDSYLLMQRDDSLLAQPFDLDTATLSGTPMLVASGVGAFAAATSGMWSAARHGALVYRSDALRQQLTWVDPGGAVLGTAGDPGEYAGPAISPDGKRLAFASTDTQGNSDVWIRDLASGVNSRLTFDPRLDEMPVWSPDGTRIAYAAIRARRKDLYEKNADGSGEERLVLRSDRDKVPTNWSRDGRFLLFQVLDPNTQDDLWILPLEGDRQPFLFLGRTDPQRQGQFSPDQRWIAYSEVAAVDINVFVRPFTPDSRPAAAATGAVWMISTNGGATPRWSADGKRLFYVASNSDLMAVDIAQGAGFQSGAPRRLFSAGSQTLWSPSPAGDRFLFVRPSATTGQPPPFTLVLNWMQTLAR
jgi:serine/threonine protein kinase/Tol biopolymer transport system component